MTLQEFINKYTGQGNVGNTPQNMGQCVGLVSLWMDNLGVAHEYGNAKDLLTNADTNKFTITYNDFNDVNQFPAQGDIMVWDNSWGNGFGHTAVIVAADGTSFRCFEQNDITNSNPYGLCEVMNHDYTGVLGWLSPKVVAPVDFKTQVHDIVFSNAPEGDIVNRIKALFN